MKALLLLFLLFLGPTFSVYAATETKFEDSLLYDLDPVAVQAALKAGADPNESSLYKGRKVRSALSRAVLGLMAAKCRDAKFSFAETEKRALEVLALLFEAGGKIQPHDDDILYLSVGSSKVTQYLLERKANPNPISGSGNTPLILATKQDVPETIKLLLQYGAKPLSPSVTAQIRFVVAAENDDVEGMKREMARGATVDGMHPTKETALVKAASKCHLDSLNFLLSQGANPNRYEVDETVKTTPLFASVFQYVGVFQIHSCEKAISLLLKAGAHVSSTDNRDQKTPLHIAAEFSNAITVKMLLDAGAKAMPKDANGKTPLDYAVSGEVVKLLKAYGAKE